MACREIWSSFCVLLPSGQFGALCFRTNLVDPRQQQENIGQRHLVPRHFWRTKRNSSATISIGKSPCDVDALASRLIALKVTVMDELESLKIEQWFSIAERRHYSEEAELSWQAVSVVHTGGLRCEDNFAGII
jgi:hypothetical protein